jgi:hypothetical protein
MTLAEMTLWAGSEVPVKEREHSDSWTLMQESAIHQPSQRVWSPLIYTTNPEMDSRPFKAMEIHKFELNHGKAIFFNHLICSRFDGRRALNSRNARGLIAKRARRCENEFLSTNDSSYRGNCPLG